MEFSKKIYFSESAEKNKRLTLHRLKHRKYCKDTYVITLSAYNNNLLDIYPAKELLQPYYKHVNIKVVGIAKGKDDACELATQIIQEMYNLTKDFKIEAFFGFEQN